MTRFKPSDYSTVSPYLIVDGARRTIRGNAEWPPVRANVHVYVRDVDATYERALDAGAESLQEPIQMEDEDRRGGVRDAGGTTWWIATRVE